MSFMAQNKKIAVVLSGCGVYDGSEISEAVLTLLHISKQKADCYYLAPNIPQREVTNHLVGGRCEGEIRNVLVEAARIARGKIKDIAHADPQDYDGAIFPGGYGAAKNLSNFASMGVKCELQPAVQKFITAMNSAGKPLGFICISPALAAKALGHLKPTLTIGNDTTTANALTELGAYHIETPVDEICIDEKNRIVSTPAYMIEDATLADISTGIEKLVKAVLKLIPKNSA
jgi:enhancing lycopene biosynthesis protein 2